MPKGWGRTRMIVLRRARFLCQTPMCGARATDVDHIVPRSRGGTHELVNLQALCSACHTRKTLTEATEARRTT